MLFAKITPCFENGKAAIVAGLPNSHGAGSTEFYVLRPVIVPSALLFYWVKTAAFLKTAEAHMTGTVGQKRVPKTFVESHPFPLPPLNEQKRIVAKLDAIMPRIDSAKERLEKIPAILKRFRQSVLTAAVTGKLTEKWREDHPDMERADFALSIVSKKVADSYLNVFEETQTYLLPDTWLYVPLENLGEVRGGGTPSKSQADFWSGAIPWISPKDMKVCKIKNGEDFISETALHESSVKMIELLSNLVYGSSGGVPV